jgi:hypothetical protein
MFPNLRRTARRLRRVTRPVLAALLVLAQGVAAVGGPVVVRQDGSVRPCGCTVRGPLAACCCGPGGCCDLVAELAWQPPAEPEPPACPHCPAKARAEPAKPTVLWVAALQTRQCGGEGPLGLVADIPAVPPVVPATGAFAPRLTHSVSLTDLFATSPGSIPPDPPPRRG